MMKSIFIIFGLCYSCFIYSQANDSTFALCEKGRIWPYYYPVLKYEGGFWEIKKHFEKSYPRDEFSKLSNSSGIITVQFHVNCEGQTGNYRVLQCDLNYKPTVLNKQISQYFLKQTQLLKGWIPATDEEGNIVNSHKFLSFRIEQGQLIQILPK